MRNKAYILVLFMMFFVLGINVWAVSGEPVARFQFTKTQYSKGEKIKVNDLSYAKDGKSISKREWKVIVNGKEKTSTNILALTNTLKVGEYTIYLRVKDSSGIWSDWTSNKLSLKVAQPIKITSFKPDKNSFAQGEKVSFTYEYDNPNDLGITGQRWRYRNLTTGGSTILSRPKYFKRAGKYEVSLEVQDEWGNWSNRASCIVVVTQEQIERNGYYLFSKGKPGDLLDGYIDKDYNTFEALENSKILDIEGKLLMSNSPESIPSSGVLYKDDVINKGRIIVHHNNATNYNKKLLILATTKSNNEVELNITNRAIEGPHGNILATGQKAVRNYFKGGNKEKYIVKPGNITCIYDSSKQGIWEPGKVISGTLDFNTTDQLTLTIVAMDATSNLENVSKLTVLPSDGVHVRGTFSSIERIYNITIDDLKESAKLVVGREEAEWLVGKDALTGKEVKNKGNYGLAITLNINVKEEMGIILNARGGSYLGAVKWNASNVFNVPSEDILNGQKLAALIGHVEEKSNCKIEYMLPNGSSAPVLFGFVPKHLWK